MKVLVLVLLLAVAFAGCTADVPPPAPVEEAPLAKDPYIPHVIIGIPDTGIDPYHHIFYRPNLTEHPCTYIRDFPCDIPALNLTLGGDNAHAAFRADQETWDAMERGVWYWIPRSVFVAVSCDPSFRGSRCLTASSGHGTGTVSSALTENPDALVAFRAGGSDIEAFFDSGIPVDIFSVSWGSIVPIPVALSRDAAPLYVLAAGNDPRSTLLDSWSGDPRNIVVGGAYAASRSEHIMSAKQPDVVSYFSRPVAEPETMNGMTNASGTSFAAPTVAGALSKVILAVRNATGYNGTLDGDLVDPIANLTVLQLREALNRTASYDPEPRYPKRGLTVLPLNPVAPWLQWGWGFYDGWVANGTIEHLLGEPAPPKPDDAVEYMETIHEAKWDLHGPFALWEEDDAGSGRDAPDLRAPDVWVDAGNVYEGTLRQDPDRDHYAFAAEAGDDVVVRLRAFAAVVEILDENGTVLALSCSAAGWDLVFPDGDATGLWCGVKTLAEAEIEPSGTYYLRIRNIASGAQKYAFSIGIGEAAPEPGHSGQPLPPPPL